MRRLVFSVILGAGLASGGVVGIADQGAFLHITGRPVTLFNSSSQNYFSTLGNDNLGGFGWSYTNLTGASQTGVKFLAFLDADLDRGLNTFVNEYGALVSLSLPPGAPLGSVAASSWEIDEPGFVFGDIYSHLLTGSLDNSNAVPQSAADDVSLALGFLAGTLLPGEKITMYLRLSTTNIDGLSQADAHSQMLIYFNGYVTRGQVPPEPPDDNTPPGIPEPSSLVLTTLGITFVWARTRLFR